MRFMLLIAAVLASLLVAADAQAHSSRRAADPPAGAVAMAPHTVARRPPGPHLRRWGAVRRPRWPAPASGPSCRTSCSLS